jgi:hypothetical protein
MEKIGEEERIGREEEPWGRGKRTTGDVGILLSSGSLPL